MPLARARLCKAIYLMSLYVPTAEAHEVDDALRVVNHPDGWVEVKDKGKGSSAIHRHLEKHGQRRLSA